MDLKITELSTSDVFERLSLPNVKLIDIRPVEAYNGWRLSGESRGGHIINAKSLPFKWLRYLDWLDIVHSKSIETTDELIIYGYNTNETQTVAEHFWRAGYHTIHIYNFFVQEWSSNPQLPLATLSRFKQLVSARWLNTLLSHGYAPELDNQKFIVVHAYYRDSSSYNKGHIPGAVGLDTNSIESPLTWNRRPPHELKDVLEQTGISSDTTVILYGKCESPNLTDPFPGSRAGHLGAMRCAFIMLYAGVKDIRILNGGFQSWTDEGFEVSTEASQAKSIPDFGATIPQYPEFAIDTPQARDVLRSANKNLVCVRSWSEYIGQTSGYNYIKKKGRIPGAIFADCGSDAYHMENYRNVDHTTREYQEIEKNWAASNITPFKHNSFYCGTGWRASEAFINAWLMGWSDISVYDGGWFEWSSDENNPFETGIPVQKKFTTKP